MGRSNTAPFTSCSPRVTACLHGNARSHLLGLLVEHMAQKCLPMEARLECDGQDRFLGSHIEACTVSVHLAMCQSVLRSASIVVRCILRPSYLPIHSDIALVGTSWSLGPPVPLHDRAKRTPPSTPGDAKVSPGITNIVEIREHWSENIAYTGACILSFQQSSVVMFLTGSSAS